jgi:hypothetical protein
VEIPIVGVEAPKVIVSRLVQSRNVWIPKVVAFREAHRFKAGAAQERIVTDIRHPISGKGFKIGKTGKRSFMCIGW